MTEDHGLSNGDGPVDVAEGHELLLFAVTDDVVLLDGVLLPHHLLKRGREQENRTLFGYLLLQSHILLQLNQLHLQ
uniref:Uncharacterized protein n=1 Tax=Oncorhynchus mykiss TaxID=8022 RepID=A0A8C7RJD1_ONCMY